MWSGALQDLPRSKSELVLENARLRHLAQARSEEEFLSAALNGLRSYPTYFNYLRAVDQLRTNVLHSIPRLSPLNPHDVPQQMTKGVRVVNARPPLDFAVGHIPNAYGIPLDTPLGTWAGWVIPFNAPLILVARMCKNVSKQYAN